MPDAVSAFALGTALGVAVTTLLHLAALRAYRRILKLKAQDRSAECIDGEFFVLLPEKVYHELILLPKPRPRPR